MNVVRLATFVVIAATTGCKSFQTHGYDYCAVAKPIIVCKSDQLCDETAKQVLAHNETWAKLCSNVR